MPNQQTTLDHVFHALADPTRRAVLHRLVSGPGTVSELAKPFEMALPSFLQHLRVLEDSGLIRSTKAGRVRTCQIEPQRLAMAEQWIAHRRAQWQGHLDRLGIYLEEQESTETTGLKESGND